MKEYLPQIDIDGTKNIWIVKPGAKSRGRGKAYLDPKIFESYLMEVTSINKQSINWSTVGQYFVERQLVTCLKLTVPQPTDTCS